MEVSRWGQGSISSLSLASLFDGGDVDRHYVGASRWSRVSFFSSKHEDTVSMAMAITTKQSNAMPSFHANLLTRLLT